MYGAKLYELKEQKSEEKKEKEEQRIKEEEKRKLESAKKRIETIKKDLEELANKGEDLKIAIKDDNGDEKNNLKPYFDKLRELGWEEGISIYKIFIFNKYQVEYYASIENLFQNKSLNEYIYINQKKYLTDEEKDYIQKEENYFNQLLNGTEPYYIYERETEFRENPLDSVAVMALANAAYRIGMEGVFGLGFAEEIILQVEPTYSEEIDSSKMDYQKYENYIEIMHRYYKEKREQDSQVPKQKGKNPNKG